MPDNTRLSKACRARLAQKGNNFPVFRPDQRILRWSDLNFTRREILIERALSFDDRSAGPGLGHAAVVKHFQDWYDRIKTRPSFETAFYPEARVTIPNPDST